MSKVYSKCCGEEVDYSEIQNPEGWFDRNEIPIVIASCPKCKAKPCKTMTEEEYINAREHCPPRNN